MKSKNEKCIFCKIVKKQIESFVIKENKNFMAILDIYPQTKGQTLIISKKHYTSDPLKLPSEILKDGIEFAQQIGKLLIKKLGAKRVFFVIEGMEIDHFHIKLYPFYKISSKIIPTDLINLSMESYPGFLITLHGPRANKNELKIILEKLKINHKRIK